MAKKLSDAELRNLVRDKKNEELMTILGEVCPLHTFDSCRRTVLHLAAKFGNSELIKYSLEHNCCSINEEDSSGMTPLITALSNNQFEASKLLLKAQPTIPAKNASTLMPTLRLVVSKKAPAEVMKEFIAYLRKLEVSTAAIVRMLQRADCSLKYALKLNDTSILRVLIEQKDPISYDESMMLVRKAMKYTSRESIANLIVLMTVGHESDVRKSIFFKELHLEMDGWLLSINITYVKHLTKQMMKFNAIDRHFAMYLAGAFEKCGKRAVKTWLESNIHVHVKQVYGRDLLAHLFGNKRVKAIEMVEKMKLKLDVCGKSSGGFSALHFAVMNDMSKNVEYLLKNGMDPNVRSDLEMTPLFIAHDRQCVKLLLQYGADVQAVDLEGLSIIEVNHCSQTYELVIAHLAVIEAKGDEINSGMYDKINAIRGFKEFYEKCRLQVEWMKRRKIFQSVTLFDIFIEDPEKIAKFMANKEKGINLMDWYYECTMERYYFKILKKNLKKAVKIYKLKSKAVKILASIIRVCDANHLVVRKIVGYLRYEDLLVFA